MKGNTSTVVTKNVTIDTENPEESKKYAYQNNYQGKNPMNRTQWRRYQRSKKGIVARTNDRAIDPKEKLVETIRRPVKRLSLPPVEGNATVDDEMDSEPDFDVICNVVSILPAKYDVISKVEESKADYNPTDMEKYKSMCCYVTDYDYGNQPKAIFEKPNGSMKIHLKPLFIQAKVDDVRVNKVFVDGSATVNLMPQSLLKRIGKCDADLKHHNIVLSNYEGKTGFSLGALQVSLTVGFVTRPTLFIVVPSKANFNLLLGRECIHGIGVIPSSMHQKVIIWRDDGLVEDVEADQSWFLAEVDNITKKTFEKSLAKIAPCSFAEDGDSGQIDAVSVRLDPTHGFMLEKEILYGKRSDFPPGKNGLGNDHV